MIINQNQAELIEEALLASSYYIADNIDAICDDDYLEESEDVLSQVDSALDLLRSLMSADATTSNCHDGI